MKRIGSFHHTTFVLALLALLTAACRPSESAPRTAITGSRDSASGGAPNAGTAELTEQSTDSLPLFRWSVAEGSRLVGHIPGDAQLDDPGQGIVGPGGILLWRYRGDAGDYIFQEPWLARPGAGRTSLREPSVYLFTDIAWLGGKDLVAMSMERRVELRDASGRVVRGLAVDADTSFLATSMAVHPVDGRIAVILAHTDVARGVGDANRLLDLAVLSADGKRLARIRDVARPRHSDGFLETPALFWVAGDRIAFMRELAPGATPIEGEGVPRSLALANPGRGVVEATGVAAHGIATVSPEGQILLTDGRLYDPLSGTVRTLPLADDGIDFAHSRFSPDGQWLTAQKWGEAGTRTLGVLHPTDGGWRELGRGTALGWTSNGELYWVGRE